MCGIIAGIAQRNVTPILLEGLKRLEYRGYDSAGLAVANNGHIYRKREVGKVCGLQALIDQDPIKGFLGLAHTRWATHGKPSVENAHPHVSLDKLAVVHNGIIENHAELRAELLNKGYHFTSQTDTEVVVHLIAEALRQCGDFLSAVKQAVARLQGAYALGIINADCPDLLIACRKGSPLVIGVGIGEYFIASDIAALLPVTQRFIYLQEGDLAALRIDGATIYDKDDKQVARPLVESQLKSDAVDKGAYRHYMLKEIHEQARAATETLEGRVVGGRVLDNAFGHNAAEVFDTVKSVQIIACGTSYHAGLVARYWFETLAKIRCTVDVASEFRYRDPVITPDTLVVVISQSGETADTLAALMEAKRLGVTHTLAICNVPESSLVREAELALMTRAGPEIGVASTKAFTTQLLSLLMLVVALGRRFGLSKETEREATAELLALPASIEKALKLDPVIEQLAQRFLDKQNALFLGRGAHYPIALEGALKLKEISYIHAEAYPAGELKHGPLALIDGEMPVITVAPNNYLLEKLKSNIQEVSARGGQLIVFIDESLSETGADNIQLVKMPRVDNIISPIVYAIPLQLLAYHVAVLKGTDIDQPRNLAKSVTVE